MQRRDLNTPATKRHNNAGKTRQPQSDTTRHKHDSYKATQQRNQNTPATKRHNNATKTRQPQNDATTQAKHSSYKTTQQRSQNTAVTKRRNNAHQHLPATQKRPRSDIKQKRHAAHFASKNLAVIQIINNLASRKR